MFKFLGVKSNTKKKAAVSAPTPAVTRSLQNISSAFRQELNFTPVLKKTLSDYNDRITALASLPSGELVSGSGNSIKIWDCKTGKCIQNLTGDEDDGANALILLPSGELISNAPGNLIKVWNTDTGMCVRTLEGHTSWVKAFTVLPNGKLASGSNDKSIKVWDIATGVCIRTLEGNDNTVESLAVLPNGELASGGYGEGKITLWNITTGSCVRELSGHLWGRVDALVVLSNGHLVSGSSDHSIKIWNYTTGQCIQTLSGHTDSIKALILLANGELVSGSGGDGEIKIWNLTTGNCRYTQHATNSVEDFTVLPSGELVSAVSFCKRTHSYDNSIKVWDLGFRPTPAQAELLLRKSAERINRVKAIAAREGSRLSAPVSKVAAVSSPVLSFTPPSKSAPALTFRQEPGFKPCQVETLNESSGNTHAFQILTSGQLASDDGKRISIWDLTNNSRVMSLKGHTDTVRALQALPNNQLASGSNDYMIRIWDVTNNRCVAILEGRNDYVVSLQLLSDGRLASDAGITIRIWDLSNYSCVATLSGHTSSVSNLAVLPDGRLASGACDNTIRIWDLTSHRCIAIIDHSTWVKSLQALPDGRLVSGGYDKKAIRIWDLTSNRCVATLDDGSDYAADTFQILPNSRLASGSYYGETRIWDLVSNRCVATLEGHKNVQALQLLPNGQLVSGSEDKIRIWDLGLRPVLALKSENAVKPSASTTTTKASTDWTMSDFATGAGAPPQPPKPIITALSEMSVSPTGLRNISARALELKEPPLAQGGFGVVYEGMWNGRRVAVKKLKGTLTPDLLEEFRRESEIHARLHQNNIIALYGVCVESMNALVLEFMPYGSLYMVLKRPPVALTWSVRLSLSLDIVSGLLYLHSQNIIHRDLKSLNVLVDEHMQAKISDFGLSKIKVHTASGTKATGSSLGSLYWKAPELFKLGGQCSKATDIYALAIVFWEIVTQQLPYASAEGDTDVIRGWVKDGEREAVPAHTPIKFAQLIQRCWAQRADDRPVIEEVMIDMRKINAAEASKTVAVDSGFEYSGKLR